MEQAGKEFYQNIEYQYHGVKCIVFPFETFKSITLFEPVDRAFDIIVYQQHFDREDESPDLIGHTDDEQCAFDAIYRYRCCDEEGEVERKRAKPQYRNDHKDTKDKKQAPHQHEEFQIGFLFCEGLAEKCPYYQDGKNSKNSENEIAIFSELVHPFFLRSRSRRA